MNAPLEAAAVPALEAARAPLVVQAARRYPRAVLAAAAMFALAAFLAVPVLHLAVPAEHPLHLSDYFVTLVGKVLCYAIVAVALDLIWGYAGILSLGHGLFFALGGYAFGMYLMRQIGRDGSYRSDLPDFMVFLDWKALPWYWQGSDSFLWALVLVVAVPALLAFAFGYFAFRSRIRGVYFSIITQALTFAFMLLFFRNETGFGGNNGFTDFKRVLGVPITEPETRVALFALSAAALLGALFLCRFVVTSKSGRVLTAIREDASINLEAVDRLVRRFPGLDVVFVESGGDNLAATFSPELSDLTLYVIDVAAGDKIPRKGGPGITRSDLLVINKIDLAPYVGASLEVMDRDARKMRGERPFVFTNLKAGQGLDEIVAFIEAQGMLSHR